MPTGRCKNVVSEFYRYFKWKYNLQQGSTLKNYMYILLIMCTYMYTPTCKHSLFPLQARCHNYFTIKVQNKKKPFVSCRRGSCKKANLGLQCEIGLRTRTFHILSGSVLSVWSKVESVLAGMPGGSTSKMQIIRLKTDCGQRIVGKLYMYISVSLDCNLFSFWLT